MTDIMIARRTGTVYIDGRRRMVRRGQTTAHADHPLVAGHPNLFEPLRIDYPTAGGGDPAERERIRGNARAYLLMYDHLAAVAVRLADAAAAQPEPSGELSAACTAVREVLAADPDGYRDQVDTAPAGDAFADAAAAAGLPFAQALRTLAQGLAERGYQVELGADGEAGLPQAVVETALEAIDTADWARPTAGAQPVALAVDVAPDGSGVVAMTTADGGVVVKPAPAADPDEVVVDDAAFRAAVRAWAAQQEPVIEVSPRGKVPREVVDRYRAAHGGA